MRCHRVAHGWRGRRLSPLSGSGGEDKHTWVVYEERCRVEIPPIYLVVFGI